MKYLILANNSGGLYRFRKELMKQLILDGHEVYAVTPFDEFIQEIQAIGVQLIQLEMNRRGKNPLQELQLLASYKRIIRQICPDMIITYTIKPGIYGGLLSRFLRKTYVVNITGLGTAFQKEDFFRHLIVWLWRTALKNASCVFFENRENAQTFVNLGIVKGEKIHVLHGAGVNLTDFPQQKYPCEDRQMHFLFVGRVMREKGIEELLGAMERLHTRYPDIVLDIVGWCEEDYEPRLKALQAEKYVCFHGFQKDVKPYITQAWAFVLPSYHEGMANTLLEAAAMGRPLITTRIHGCMEAVEEGKTGYLCEVQSVDSLTEQMEKFITLPYDQKVQMGVLAHEHVAANFDKKRVVEETVGILYDMGTKE